VHSFDSLLPGLAAICLSQVQPANPALPAFQLITTLTPASAGPPTYPASATASASRSQQPTPHQPETPGKRPHAPIIRGNFGLTRARRLLEVQPGLLAGPAEPTEQTSQPTRQWSAPVNGCDESATP
jgi:hypothetical protein